MGLYKIFGQSQTKVIFFVSSISFPKHGDNVIKISLGPLLKWCLKLTDVQKKCSYG